MGDDFDIRTLPANFVSVSQPSIIIERLIEKRRYAHNAAVAEMEVKKREVNSQIENEIRNESALLKDKIKKIKTDIEDSLFTLRHARAQEINLEDRPLEAGNREIVLANDTRRRAVDEFYAILISIDKKRTNQFKLILNETYAKLLEISFELPFKLEEFFGNEMVEINQLTLNNFQSYTELQSELNLQIENDTRMWLQLLCEIREKVNRYNEGVAKEMMSKSRQNLDENLTQMLSDGQLAKELNDFDTLHGELEFELNHVLRSIPVEVEDVEKWLEKTRTTLAGLDQSARNIVMIYKSTIVIIFNRFFEELEGVKKFLVQKGIVDGNDIEDYQKEFYTPGVSELNLKYEADFEKLKIVWNEVINYMTTGVEETYAFLRDCAYLFDLHFQRLEEARHLVKRDVKNLVQKNNITTEIAEGKINIMIDKLRQGPTARKLDKYLAEVKKALDGIQKLYNAQSTTEMKVFQKFRVMVNTEIDILMVELLRFLTLYPPDEEHDPKKQRRRASQISDLVEDPKDELIPMQMLFSKFQVEAVRNWQFGLWEAINNYTQVGRTEILESEEEWIKAQITKINGRMNIRLAFHKPRYQRIICSVFEKRLYELEKHISRFTSHKTAVDTELKNLKEKQKSSEERYDEICKNFNAEALQIGDKILNTRNSGQVRRFSALLKKYKQDAVDSLHNILTEDTSLCNKLIQDLKLADIKFAKAMKFFSEGGNYTIEEVKTMLKRLKSLEKGTAKKAATIIKENGKIQLKFIATLDSENVEVYSGIQDLIEEHEHNERSVGKIMKLQNNIREEVIKLKRGTKNMETPFQDLVETSKKKLGQHDYMESFFYKLKECEVQILEQAHFLLHPEPVIMYSRASGLHHTSTSESSKRVGFKNYTSLLFDEKPDTYKECFVSKLNNYLYNSLLDIQLRAQEFYTKHDQPMLDSSKIQPNYDCFMEEVLEKYKKYLAQCEVSWVENVHEFLVFLNEFLRFREDYLTAFEGKFYSSSHEYCSTVLGNVLKLLREDRDNMKNQLHAVHHKLKALHGHPKNRHLLENIDKEFKELVSEINTRLETIAEPYKDILTEECITVKGNSRKTVCMLRELQKNDNLSHIKSKLNEHLSIKMEFMMAECDGRSDISSKPDDIMQTISKQIMNYMTSDIPLQIKRDNLLFSARESYDESSVCDFLDELDEVVEKNIETVTDFVATELVAYHENFQKIWPSEIKIITSLYEVKYDTGKVAPDI